MKTRLSLFLGLFVVCFGFSQTEGYWTKNIQKFSAKNISSLGADVNTTNKTIYRLDEDGIRKALASSPQRARSSGNSDVIISFPNSEGQFEQYRMTQTSVLHPDLAKKYPTIKSYVGRSVSGDGSQVHLSLGRDGLHAMFFKPGAKTNYIDPYTTNRKNYIVYGKADMSARGAFKCHVEETIGPKNIAPNYNDVQQRNPNDGTLRTYRLAIASTGEYSQYHLRNQDIPASATQATKKSAVLSAMNTTMTRVNGVYEKDLGVTMQIVANNDKLIFLNANTDNLTNNNASALINESQAVCDSQIGNSNYDIGHTFSTGGGGLAGLSVVCRNGRKGSGITGRDKPISDPFDIDYVAHEIGHQFGANHTQNNSCNRNSRTAIEPGSASTIMGYAGICSPNVQNKSDDHFHAISIQEMWSHVSRTSCAKETITGNNAPTANAGRDFTIPKSTPFVLKGSGTDSNAEDKLTYNWEQMDTQVATMPPRATNTGGPAFRSIPSKTSPDRYMPDLATVIAGNTASTWEVVPSVARTMNFRLTVRDNHVGGGNTASDDTRITVSGAAGPFVVNAPNTAVSWAAGSSQTVTWNVAGTTGNGVNAANVDILLSTDGGKTYPVTVASAIPNDGSHRITVPNNRGSQNRIMVRGTNHIFYDISNTNFTITGGVVDNEAPSIPSNVTASNETQTTIDLSWTASTDNVGVTGYEIYRGNTRIATIEGTRYQAMGLTPGTEYSFRVKAKDAAGNISGFSNTATATTLPEADTEAPTVPSRLAASNETQTTIDLTWEASTDNVGVTGYEVYQGETMIATVSGTRYQAAGLTPGTEYSFRVKAKDAAGNESGFSNTATATTLPEADTEVPTVPSRLAASNETQTTIDLTWEASTDNVGVTEYEVYQGETMIATVPGTRYQAAGLTPGTEYSFRVKAKDAAGNESEFSNTATAATLPDDNTDTEAPTTPTDLTASNETQTTIDLNWGASTDNVGVTGYDIYQGDTMITTITGTRYQVMGLTPGTEYSFRIKAIDAAGNKSEFSNTATASTLPDDNTDTEAPTTPTDLTASNETQTTIDLNWGASTDNVGVTGYDIYQGDTMITTITGTRYQVMGLTPGTEYSFRIKAKDAAGNESEFSNTATAATLPDDNTDTEAPTEPSRLVAANETQTTIDLTWEPSTDNVGVTGYEIYKGDEMIATVEGTRYQVMELTPGTEYSFRVKAKDAAGNESEFSNTATAATLPDDNTDTEAPTEPSKLVAANETQTTIDLTWEPSTDNVEVTGYEIYKGDEMIATVEGTRYQVMELTPGTEYSFRVKAKDAAGNESGFSNTATAATLPDDNTDTEAPTEPTELMAGNETQTTIDLNWMASTDNVGVTGYKVYQDGVMIATVEETKYQVINLIAGLEYSFTVLALDAAGNKSKFSNTVTASTLPEDIFDIEPPTAPTELVASNVEQTSLLLTWMSSTDNVGVTGYNVYQGTDMIGTTEETSFNVSGLTASTTYEFTVIAMDAIGNMSEYSNVATATTKDEDTTNICEGVAPWQWGVPYQTGDRVVYRGNLFEKLVRGWKFIAKCGASSCEGIDDWKSGTSYNSGDKVVYRGNLWQRTDRGWIFVSSCGAKSSKIAPPQERFAIYPNPSRGTINTTYTLSDQRTTYSISDILGRIVVKGDYTSTSYDVSQLKAGTYIFIITTNKASYKTAFVKE
ncbi:fibronectin type III domain-containing protein [Aquimarina sp. 2201CG1-2-11]|uniref:fibronectin type III domain-containing protein n=1 Tax=Aquimarina discodermiae TaxID=3231043 RepID=UPI003461F4D5